jgi:NAD-dependent dihydropyrimidine dehydrogenase PreA subunit
MKNVVDVARWRLCVGCGACLSICPEQKIELVDIEDDGIRPVMVRSWKARKLGSEETRTRGQHSNGKTQMTNVKSMSNDKGQNHRASEPKREQEQKAGNSESCENCRVCLEVCPGMKMGIEGAGAPAQGIPELQKTMGNRARCMGRACIRSGSAIQGVVGRTLHCPVPFLFGERDRRWGGPHRERP